MTINDSRTVLLVDDDETFGERMSRALQSRGLLVTHVTTLASALRISDADSPELAVVDLRLPDGHGLDVVRHLHSIDETTRIIVLTGYGAIATAVESLKLGASDYLTKPIDADQLMAAFERDDDARTSSARSFTVPSLARVEWEHIQRVLADCGGNISEAARALHMHRRSLQRKISKYPVNM
ncbi:MAG TPA: response regulator [Vicinamibacterales bacterium]|nr:response regulator [Vicinamibacterales bacterium]